MCIRDRRSTLEIAATWLACGLDIEKNWFYRQSDIPEIPELMWLSLIHIFALLSALDAGDVLLVGVGTALTIDWLDADGLHHGGRIAPSPMLMREALHARAAVLPESGGSYAEFADDTDHALASGCEGAALALIERSLEHASGMLGATPALWLHGGGAQVLSLIHI